MNDSTPSSALYFVYIICILPFPVLEQKFFIFRNPLYSRENVVDLYRWIYPETRKDTIIMKIKREEIERERNYLNKTVSIIRKKISNLGQELYNDDSKILEFKKFIWDTHAEMDPNEMRNMMAE